MTKKHYEAVASILKSTYNNAKLYNGTGYRDTAGERLDTLEVVASRLADYFASDNPRFDRVRFLKACGIEQEKYRGSAREAFDEAYDLAQNA